MKIYNFTGQEPKNFFGVIYGIENCDSHKNYIGQTVQKIHKRIYNHKIAKTYIGNAIREHTLEKFFIVVIEVCKDKEQLNQREIFWISKLNCKYPNGYNLTDGGENPPSMKGKKLSSETRAKMSAAHIGKKRPPEVCKKISESKIGHEVSTETRKKLAVAHIGKSPANKGKKASLESRLKMSAAKKGKPSKRKGKHQSLESRLKMSAAHIGKKTWNKGVPCAEEVKLKISETLKNRNKAEKFLKDLGGKNNIVDVTNCATRLRVTVKDDTKIADVGTFTEHGAHGLVHNGRAIQVIVGLSVPQVRERFENLLNAPDEEIFEAEEEVADAMNLKAVVSGKIIDISEVPDEMFAKKMMGDGVAIQPTDEIIFAPADAEVTMIAEESLHAIGLHLKNGADILIHIGIDTVNLKGKGFKIFTKQGANVKAGDKLVKFDRKIIADAGYKDIVIIAVTNSTNFPEMKKILGDAEGGKTFMIENL